MILLIQFRTDQSGPHEVKCFYDGLGIDYSDMQVLNAADPDLTSEEIRSYVDAADIVILGGSGEATFHSEDRKERELSDMLRAKMLPVTKYMLVTNKPLLGVCYGFQLMAEATGVPVLPDEDQAEAGVVDVVVDKENQGDPIFKEMPHVFAATAAHKESVMNVPEDAEVLASSSHCENHVIRYGAKQYGLMFHPELNQKELQFRLDLYPEYNKNKGGSMEDKSIDERVIVTHQILKNFVDIAQG